MHLLNKNTQFLFNDKSNLGIKKLQKTKSLIFLKRLSTRQLKAERFIDIVKSQKMLRVLANFKKSTNKHPERC